MARLFFYSISTIILTVALVLSGCSSSENDSKGKQTAEDETKVDINTGAITLATEETAILYFQKRAKEIFAKNEEKIKNPKLLLLLDDKKNIAAKRRNLRDCYKRIQDTLTEEQQLNSIIYGKLANLGFLQDAWEIEVGQFEINIGACIDIQSGRVMVLWINQEDSINEDDEDQVKNQDPSQPDTIKPDQSDQQSENSSVAP